MIDGIRRRGACRATNTQATPDLKVVADFLRGKNGPKTRRGILNGKRVDYFKGELTSDQPGESSRGDCSVDRVRCSLAGKTAIRVLLGPAYAKVKKAPKVTTEEEATALLNKVLPQ